MTRKGQKCNFGLVLPLCHVKHSEMAKEFQSCKGRIVYQGNNVTDEEGQKALFDEKGSSSCLSSQSKLLDYIGRLPGCTSETSDAVKAYIQALLKDYPDEIPTWV